MSGYWKASNRVPTWIAVGALGDSSIAPAEARQPITAEKVEAAEAGLAAIAARIRNEREAMK